MDNKDFFQLCLFFNYEKEFNHLKSNEWDFIDIVNFANKYKFTDVDIVNYKNNILCHLF